MLEKLLDTPPPSIVPMERAVLGCVLLYPETINTVLFTGKEEWFYHSSTQQLFRVLQQCFTKKLPIDLLALESEAKLMGIEWESLFIASLISEGCNPHSLVYNLSCIEKAYKRRQNINMALRVLKTSQDLTQDPSDILNEFQTAMLNTYQGSSLSLEQETNRILSEMESKTPVLAISTPFWQLNTRLTLKKKFLYTIGGETSHGKTAFLINLVNHWIRNKVKVLLASYETVSSNVPRMIATEYGISTRKAFNPFELSPKERDTYLLGISDLLTFNDYFLLLDNPTTTQLLSQIRIFQPDVVLIDYFQLYYMKNSEKRSNSETDAMTIGRSVAQLREIAQKENICLIQTSQLTRPKEQKLTITAPKYSLYRLKESGYIEQFSAAVLIVWWENDESAKENTTYSIYINKNTFGRKGEIKLKIDPSTQRLTSVNMAQQQSNEEAII